MGRLRMLVEATQRDVVFALHRHTPQCSPECIQDVRARLAKLLAEVVRFEEVATHQQHALPPRVLCEQIVHGIIDDVAGFICPTRENEALKESAVAHRRRIAELERAVASLQAELNLARGELSRHARAHRYSLEAYFKESLLLRNRDAVVAAAAVAACNSTTDDTIPASGFLLSTSSRTGGSSDLFALSQSIQSASKGPQQLTTGGAASATAPAAATAQTAQLIERLTAAVAALSPEVLARINADAVFDYTRYIDMQQAVSIDLQERYHNLVAEHSAFQEQVKLEREKAEAHYAAVVKGKTAEVRELYSRIAELTIGMRQMRDVVKKHLRGLRGVFDPLKSSVTRAQVSIEAMSTLVQSSAASMHLHTDLLVNYITSACHFMTSQSISEAHDTFSRTQFQRALASDDKDQEPVRLAKQWWRKHHVTGTVLATIVAVRKVHASNAEITRRLNILSVLPQQLPTPHSGGSVSAAGDGGGGGGSSSSSSPFMRQKVLFAEAAQLGDDFAFLHRLFAMAGDISIDMAPQDRAAILDAARRHRELSHRRSRAIFDRVDARLRLRARLRLLEASDPSGTVAAEKAAAGSALLQPPPMGAEEQASDAAPNPFSHLGASTLERLASRRNISKPSAEKGKDSESDDDGESAAAEAARDFYRGVLLRMNENHGDREIRSLELCAAIRAKMVENATQLLALLDRNLVRRVTGNVMPRTAGLAAMQGGGGGGSAGAGGAPPRFSFIGGVGRRQAGGGSASSSRRETSVLWEGAAAGNSHSVSPLAFGGGSGGGGGGSLGGSGDGAVFYPTPPNPAAIHGPPGAVVTSRPALSGLAEIDPRDEVLMVIKGIEPRRAFILPTTGGIAPPEIARRSLATLAASSGRVQQHMRSREEAALAEHMYREDDRARRHDAQHGRLGSAGAPHAPTDPPKKKSARRKKKPMTVVGAPAATTTLPPTEDDTPREQRNNRRVPPVEPLRASMLVVPEC